MRKLDDKPTRMKPSTNTDGRYAAEHLESDGSYPFDPKSEWFAIIAAVDRNPQYNLYTEGMNCDEGD